MRGDYIINLRIKTENFLPFCNTVKLGKWRKKPLSVSLAGTKKLVRMTGGVNSYQQ